MGPNLQGLVEFFSGISYLVVVSAAVASMYYLASFGMGLLSLGESGSMNRRPSEPKEVISRFIGAILFGSFTTVLYLSHNTIIDNQTAFIANPVYAYTPTNTLSTNNNAQAAGLVVRAAFQMMSLFFLYGSFLKAIDAGKSDGSEKGALGSAVSKLIAAVALWTPEVTIGYLDFIPFFDVMATLLSGSSP